MTFFLTKGQESVIPPPAGPDLPFPSFWEGAAAAGGMQWQRTDVARQRSRQVSKETDTVAADAAKRIGLEGMRSLANERKWRGSRVTDLQVIEGETPEDIAARLGPNGARVILDRARELAAADPASWQDMDLSDEGIEARVTERRAKELAENQAILSMSPMSGLASVTGTIGAAMLDPVNIGLTAISGGGGSLLRIMGREAIVNATAEALTLPAQFRVAKELDQPTPSILETLAIGAAGGAALGGGIEGLARGFRYMQTRETITPSPGVDPVRQAAAIDAAEDAIIAGENPAEAVDAVLQPRSEPQAAETQPEAAQVASTQDAPVGANLEVLDNTSIMSIGVDAKTFQFKSGGDDQGVTDRLRGVTTWEPERSGVALVYEYADGRRVIVDGHQRLGLAKRLAAEGKPVEMPVRILREADGVTVEQARARAALKNIAEGTGSPLDAAKVLRDLGVSADKINLPPNSALVRQGEGLSRLSDDAFGMVVNERGTEAHGALVGRIIDDPALHADILALVTRLKPKNAFEAESIIRQAKEAGATVETQASLFGDEMVSQSLFLERARVLDATVKRLKEDRGTFNVLLERSGTISGAGNQLDAEANAKRFLESGELMQYVQTQANMKGPISDALTEAARAYKSGGKIGKSVDAVVEAVRSAIQRGDGIGGAGRLGRGEAEPAPAAVAPEPVDAGPGLFDAPVASERTAAGEQTLIPGVAPVAPSLTRPAPVRGPQEADSQIGGMFDLANLSMRDMFDDPEGPKAQAFLDSMVVDLKAELEKGDMKFGPVSEDGKTEGDFFGLVTDEGTQITSLKELVDEIEAYDTLAREIELCRTGGAQ